MKTKLKIENMTEPEVEAYFKARLRETKAYGYTYVHSGMRAGQNTTINGIRYYIGGYGRSLQNKRGHKYKVTAHKEETALA